MSDTTIGGPAVRLPLGTTGATGSSGRGIQDQRAEALPTDPFAALRAMARSAVVPVMLALGATGAVAAPASAQTAPAAQVAVDTAPTPAQAPTDLQKHLIFFDGNHDGQLTQPETQAALMKLKMADGSTLSPTEAKAISIFINGGLAKASGGSGLTVNVAGIHMAEHGSDTGIYDKQGNFVPSRLDAVFQKYDSGNKGYLTEADLKTMRHDNRTDLLAGIHQHGWAETFARIPSDVAEKGFSKAVKDGIGLGTLASKGEFDLLLKLAGENRDVDGQTQKVLTKDRMAQFYRGELWYTLAGEPVPTQWSVKQ